MGNKLWPSESVVKHYDKLYQAINATNAAEPGNQVHNRFYVSIFHISVYSGYSIILQVHFIEAFFLTFIFDFRTYFKIRPVFI